MAPNASEFCSPLAPYGGRGTTVCVVVAADDGGTYLALRTSWQDVARANGQSAVLKKLSDNTPHPNIVVPPKLFEAECGGVDSTLGSTWALLDDEMRKLRVENRILTVTISELKRPVAYFWSPHDFVRRLVSALLGTLHRDISENTIVLRLCRDHPGNELGALIEFDMAIVGRPKFLRCLQWNRMQRSCFLSQTNLRRPDLKTTSHTGRNVPVRRYICLLVSSVLFFFSYAKPLEEEALRRVRAQGFIQPAAAGDYSTCCSMASHV